MRSIIIDCDPGVDDATALFLAFAARDHLHILGITTVAGNVGPELTQRNACLIREMAQREEVPIYAGCAQPLVRPALEARDFHGMSGLGPLTITHPAKGVEGSHAVPFLIDTIMQAPAQTITLVVTGPSTNLAAALAMEPRLTQRLREVVMMGGASREGGNITASAEFNVYADPHAAAAVMASGIPLTIFSLDVTHQVRTHQGRVERFKRDGGRIGGVIAQLFAFSNTIKADVLDVPGAPLHDPCPIAYLLAPMLFRLKPCHVSVETAGSVALGHVSADFRGRDGRAFNAQWAVGVDAEALFDLILEYVKRL